MFSGCDNLELCHNENLLVFFSVLPAEREVFATIHQAFEGLTIERGKIKVTGSGRTSLKGVWAGGDCALGGADLTVTAVAEGRDAAMDIHAALMRA